MVHLDPLNWVACWLKLIKFWKYVKILFIQHLRPRRTTLKSMSKFLMQIEMEKLLSRTLKPKLYNICVVTPSYLLFQVLQAYQINKLYIRILKLNPFSNKLAKLLIFLLLHNHHTVRQANQVAILSIVKIIMDTQHRTIKELIIIIINQASKLKIKKNHLKALNIRKLL